MPGNDREEWPLLYLYLVDHQGISHFHSITNITGFFSTHYFCDRCLKPYSTNTRHQCESKCLTCKTQGCLETDLVMSCLSCHMMCRSPECFQRHLEKKTKQVDGKEITLSQCDQFWRCTTCKRVIDRSKRSADLHKCAEWLCKCCLTWVTGNHRCYLFPDEPKKPVKKFIYFDFEATQDSKAQCEYGFTPDDDGKCQNCFKSWCGQPRHVPNFVVAQTVCEVCLNDELTPESICDECGTRCLECNAWDKEAKRYIMEPCTGTCGFREVIFQGDDTSEQFGNWLFNVQNKDATVLAHNMKVSIMYYNYIYIYIYIYI